MPGNLPLQHPNPVDPPEKCPKCGSPNLIEGGEYSLECQDCDWHAEDESDDYEDIE